MTYLITGATGSLGRLVVESLLRRGVAAGEIVAAGRQVAKLADLGDRGVRVRAIDYDDPDGIRAAFTGVHRALLVSGSDTGRRVAQHQRVIDAAASAEVDLLAYTSIANADTSSNILAADHWATEQAIHAAGVPYAILRNGFYLDMYVAQVPSWLAGGTIVGSSGRGRISVATRADLAEAAAVALTADVPTSRVYELGGEAVGMADFAAALTALTGTTVAYADLSPARHADTLRAAHLPEPVVELLIDLDRSTRAGELAIAADDLAKLLGRAPTDYHEVFATATAER